jgi:hypothetical protein
MNRIGFGTALALVVALAAVVRLPRFAEWPADFNLVRQYRCAIIARAFHAGLGAPMEEPLRQAAVTNGADEGRLEPPIQEFASALLYKLLGRETPAAPRAISVFCWLASAVFLSLVARRFTSPAGALFAAGFYLFAPFAVQISRSLQPESLMMMCLLGALLWVLRYRERPSPAVFAGGVLWFAAALLVKPQTLFVLAAGCAWCFLPSFVGPVHKDRWRAFLFAAAGLAPAAVYYGWLGLRDGGGIGSQAGVSLHPHLLVTVYFWKAWLGRVLNVVGLPALAASCAGYLLLASRERAVLAAALWSGYVAFCLVFSFHAATHDYYHTQILPLVALGVGVLAGRAWGGIGHVAGRAALALIMAGWMLSGWAAAPWRRADPALPDMSRFESTAREIGEKVGHSTRCVILDYEYAKPFKFFAWVGGQAWPESLQVFEFERIRGEDVLHAPERFARDFAPSGPEFFIVRRLREYQKQPDLMRFLLGNFPVLASSGEYLIFDLRADGTRRLSESAAGSADPEVTADSR